MFRYLLIILIICMIQMAAVAQSVENVMFKQTNDDQLLINYDLFGEAEARFNLELWVSLDGGNSFAFKPTAVIGDVGGGVAAGSNKSIVWDVFADMSKLEEDDLAFKVIALWEYWDLEVEIAKGRNNRALSKYSIDTDWGEAWAVTTEIPKSHLGNVKAGWHQTVTKVGPANPPPLSEGGALYLHPVSRSEPAILEGKFKIKSSKVSLGIHAASNMGYDWRLVVKVNGSEIGNWIVNGKIWHSFSVPLLNYNKQEINIQVCIYATGWNFEYAHISKIWFTDSSGKEITMIK